MNPASHTAAKPTVDTTRNTIARPTAATPVTASPQPVVHAKAAIPALLNLKLKLAQNPGETEAHNAAPRSPSARGKNSEKHAVAETRGQKRAIDGLDGPGISATNSPKRQRESTPPASPRSGNPATKTLVKTGRAVADLKAMASLSPRRSGTASPPASPRTGETAERQAVNSPRRATKTSSSSSSTTAASSGAAPRWRSASYSDAFDGPALFQSKLAPRLGSVSMASVASIGRMHKSSSVHSPKVDETSAPSGRATSSDEDSTEFVFTGCDYGADGLLLAAKQEQESVSAPAENSLLAPELVKAELSLAWQSLRQAEQGYLTVFDRCLAKTPLGKATDADASDSRARLATFKTAMTELDTDVMLAELALGQSNTDDGRQALTNIRKHLASCSTALMALAASEPGKRAGDPAGPQDAVVKHLQALETACTTGLDMLDDEPSPQANTTATASTASTASKTTTGRLVFTHSNQQLLDDLDALMDDEIGSAAPRTDGTPSVRQ